MPDHITTSTGTRGRRVLLVGELGRGRHILVDAEDYDRVTRHRWWLSSHRGRLTYAKAHIDGRTVSLHRWLLGLEVGDARAVDHISGDTLDNRRSNLRLCTAGENRRNSAVVSGPIRLKGVSLERGRYRAEIRANGRHHFLGLHATPEAAALAYDEACRELHGDFAVTNADAGLLAAEVVR